LRWTRNPQILTPQRALAPAEAQAAAAALEADEAAAPRLAPHPQQLPSLVLHNAGLAAQLLLALTGASQARHVWCTSHCFRPFHNSILAIAEGLELFAC